MKKAKQQMNKFFSKLIARQSGFTMIELLVVISVIGILAVAVLSSINPIEQINKGRDTRSRSDAAQLIGAVDRYFSIQEVYPWNDVNGTYWTAGDIIDTYDLAFESISNWGWVYILADVEEVKDGFVNRLVSDDSIVVVKAAGSNETMYACFLPTSNSFKREAAKSCLSTARVTPNISLSTTGDVCASTDGEVNDLNYICLP